MIDILFPRNVHTYTSIVYTDKKRVSFVSKHICTTWRPPEKLHRVYRSWQHGVIMNHAITSYYKLLLIDCWCHNSLSNQLVPAIPGQSTVGCSSLICYACSYNRGNSLNDKTLFLISACVSKTYVWIVILLWNLADGSAALLQSHLQNFRAICTD